MDWDLSAVRGRLRPPFAVVLGSPREAAALPEALGDGPAVCYQMDLHQAGRLREELRGRPAEVVTAPDVWDRPADRQTVLYPVPRDGERALKIDMVEQAFHVLLSGGTLIVLSPYARDNLFAGLVKKVFGRCHAHVTPQG